MKEVLNHTSEVEHRLAAIKICPQDTCDFFRLRESACVNLKYCLNCVYAVFDNQSNGNEEQGLCKMKR